MAITLTQYPPLISPTYSPMFYMNSSNYSSESGFKYQYDLHDVNGLIASKKVFPFPNALGRIDVSPLLKNYLTYDINYNITGSTSSNNCITEYDLYIGHAGSAHTMTPASTGIKWTFNGVDNNLDFNFTNHILDGATKKFLTNSPQTINVFLNDYYTLGAFNGVFSTSTSYAKYLYIIIHNSSEVKNYRFTIDDYLFNPGASLADVDKMIKVFGVGPKNLNASTLYNIDTTQNESGPFITSSTLYYEVYTVDISLNQTSVKYRFNVNQNAGRYDNAQLMFLNRLGQFSYFTFVGKTIQNTKLTSSDFLKNRYYQYGNTWISDITKRGVSVYNSSFVTGYVFTSDYIDQSTFDFCEELFTSPEVYYITQLGAIPLTIEDTDWINKRIVNDKVINFSLKCTESNTKKTNI